MPIRRWASLLALAGCLPPDAPPKPPAPPVDADVAELAHHWTIASHVLTANTALSDADAAAMTGRTVDVDAGTYTSPWQGSCEDAGHTRRTRVFGDLSGELGMSAAGRATAASFGLDGKLVEYRLTCNGAPRTPPLVLYVAGARAMTCFSGVCYLMQH